MKRTLLFFLIFSPWILASAGIVEKTFYFTSYRVESKGDYQTVNFTNTTLCGAPGEPLLPWHEVVLMLPPGESARQMELIEEDEAVVPGSFLLFPKQTVRPLSAENSREFVRNERIYQQTEPYPGRRTGQLLTQRLNGFIFGICTFTPVKYNPAGRMLTYFKKVTVRLTTGTDPPSMGAVINLPAAESVLNRVRTFAMNPELMNLYPHQEAPVTNYDYLIISPVAFKNEFQSLINMYGGKGVSVREIGRAHV